MAITGNVFKKLTFAGSTSASFDVAITGEGVYNAPERDVEQVVIPGRNGELMLDNGRFQNIDIVYPACIAADSQADLADAISDFRNFLCSKIGYQRLEDDYNPDEYRMAIYKSGLEVSPKIRQAGSFEIIFNCKPQRFLKSGETAVSIASGGTISNPTAFESKPILEVFGYGQILVNGYPITIQDALLGLITLAEPQIDDLAVQFSSSALNVGDTITLEVSTIRILFTANKAVGALSLTTSGSLSITASAEFEVGSDQVMLVIEVAQQTYTNGTSNSKTGTISASITYDDSTTDSGNLYIGLAYNATNDRISVSFSTNGGIWPADYLYYDSALGRITGNSTKHSTGNPLYIDCEMGECYKIEGGEIISLNHYISMPNSLPVLASGSNAVSYDNTITSFKITPRWWKI